MTIGEPYASCRKPCLILSQARQARAHRCQKVKKPGFKSSRQHHCNLKINLILTSGGRNGHCGSIPVLHGTRTSSRHAFSGATQEFFALLPVALCYEDTVCRSTKPATPSHLETAIRQCADEHFELSLQLCCGSIVRALQGLGERWAQRPSKCMSSQPAVGRLRRLGSGVYASRRSVVLGPRSPPGGCMPRVKYSRSAALSLSYNVGPRSSEFVEAWHADYCAKIGNTAIGAGGPLSSQQAFPLRLKSINLTEDPSGFRLQLQQEAHLFTVAMATELGKVHLRSRVQT